MIYLYKPRHVPRERCWAVLRHQHIVTTSFNHYQARVSHQTKKSGSQKSSPTPLPFQDRNNVRTLVPSPLNTDYTPVKQPTSTLLYLFRPKLTERTPQVRDCSWERYPKGRDHSHLPLRRMRPPRSLSTLPAISPLPKTKGNLPVAARTVHCGPSLHHIGLHVGNSAVSEAP